MVEHLAATRRRAVAGAFAVGALASTAPSPLAAWTAVAAADPRADPFAPVVALAALVAWALVAWLGVIAGLLVASRLPGAGGAAARWLARRVAPRVVRRAVEVTLGISVLAGGVGVGPALAAELPLAPAAATTTATSVPAGRLLATPDLDWPSSEESPLPARPTSSPGGPGSSALDPPGPGTPTSSTAGSGFADPSGPAETPAAAAPTTPSPDSARPVSPPTVEAPDATRPNASTATPAQAPAAGAGSPTASSLPSGATGATAGAVAGASAGATPSARREPVLVAAPKSLPPIQHPGDGAGPRAVVIATGDTLWALAAESLEAAGEAPSTARIAAAWPSWWAANRAVIGDDPDLLRPGAVLSAPPPESDGAP